MSFFGACMLPKPRNNLSYCGELFAFSLPCREQLYKIAYLCSHKQTQCAVHCRGPWRTLLTEDLDLEVFTKYMGRENFRFLKPDDPLIPYEKRGTWAMRACASQHRMDEMRGILPAENHRRAAMARLVALRAASTQPGILA